MRKIGHLRADGSTIFLMAAFYCLAVGLLIQLAVLPVLLPHIHAGGGLLKGGDWIGYHSDGAALAARIHLEGWAVWELRPRENAAIGIVAAVYAITGIHEPWILLPLNATLFALGAVCLYAIFTSVTSRTAAFLGVLPYLLFPSAALQYAQITKDVWTVAGSLLICLAFVQLSRLSPLSLSTIIRPTVLTLCGALLIWIVRPYHIELLFPGVFAMVLVLALSRLGSARHERPARAAPRLLAIALCLFAFGLLPIMTSLARQGLVEGGDTFKFLSDPVQEHITHLRDRDQRLPPWDGTFLPTPLDSRLRLIAQYRASFISDAPEAGSFVDADVKLTSASAMLGYLPRALQIGVLAPFPNTWLTSGVSPESRILRAAAGVEMALSYVTLLGLIPFWIYAAGRRTQAAMIIAFVLSTLCILAFIFPNLGTLYRLRYAYSQMLVGLGSIGWFMLLQPRIQWFGQAEKPARRP